jgi:hypothetical protein
LNEHIAELIKTLWGFACDKELEKLKNIESVLQNSDVNAKLLARETLIAKLQNLCQEMEFGMLSPEKIEELTVMNKRALLVILESIEN